MAADIGLIGLGTMGAALSLNIAEKGFPIAVFNRTAGVAERFAAEAGALAPRITATDSLEALVAAIERAAGDHPDGPRRGAGRPDDRRAAAAPRPRRPDHRLRQRQLPRHPPPRRRGRGAGLALPRRRRLGRRGGGAPRPVDHGRRPEAGLGPGRAYPQAIAARFEDTPCATWMGPDGAGHFVKTVHNGIEYADMQMIAEIYGIMRDGLAFEAEEVAMAFEAWNRGPLKSYLIEITAEVARAIDPDTGLPVIDVILDRAGQKGTGRWTAIEAQHLGAPATTIEAAVAARNISARVEERARGRGPIFQLASRAMPSDPALVDRLQEALLAGKIACYAQGFGLLAAASAEFGWPLPMAGIARVWRAGCIIRSALLDDMARALEADPALNLMFAPRFAEMLTGTHGSLRAVVAQAALSGIATPALGRALAYFDMMRTRRCTANLLQAQRDFFGAHGFERIDRPGAFHGPWGSHAPP